MSKGIVPDGPIMTDLSDVEVKDLTQEERRENLKIWNRKKWKRSLEGVDGLTYDCEECGNKFLFSQRDRHWRDQILGESLEYLSRNPVICLDCRDEEGMRGRNEVV